MYIAVAEHKINNCNIIQIKISSFHFIVVILKTFLLETIAKTRPLSIYNLVMLCRQLCTSQFCYERFYQNCHIFFSNKTQRRYYISGIDFVYNMHC